MKRARRLVVTLGSLFLLVSVVGLSGTEARADDATVPLVLAKDASHSFTVVRDQERKFSRNGQDFAFSSTTEATYRLDVKGDADDGTAVELKIVSLRVKWKSSRGEFEFESFSESDDGERARQLRETVSKTHRLVVRPNGSVRGLDDLGRTAQMVGIASDVRRILGAGLHGKAFTSGEVLRPDRDRPDAAGRDRDRQRRRFAARTSHRFEGLAEAEKAARFTVLREARRRRDAATDDAAPARAIGEATYSLADGLLRRLKTEYKSPADAAFFVHTKSAIERVEPKKKDDAKKDSKKGDKKDEKKPEAAKPKVVDL